MPKARVKRSGRNIHRSANVKEKVKSKRTGSDDFIQSISKLAQVMKELTSKAVKEYAPIVEVIINTECRDKQRIEWTLDGLLDFCFDPSALVVYKKLCRYYYNLDPMATVSYVHAYRDMWDSDEVQEASIRTKRKVRKS